MWKAGDKAYCINRPKIGDLWVNPSGTPVKGSTYLVIEISKRGGLMLAGYPAYFAHNMEEIGYQSHNFSKIVTKTERKEMEAKV